MVNKTKIRVNRNIIKQFLVVLLFVVPYIESGPFVFAFTNANRTFYFRSILLFQVTLFVCLFLRYGSTQIKGAYNKQIFLAFVYLLVSCFLSLILGGDIGAILVTFISFIIPLINSYLVLKGIRHKGLDVGFIIKLSINTYALFVIYCIAFNMAKYGLVLSYVNNKFRLSASAGGPVILGYTISLVFVYMIANKDLFSFKNLIINSLIFVLAVTYTMDRGAYMILLVGLFYAVITEKNKIMTGVFILAIVFGIVYYSEELFGRLIELLFGNRVMSTDLTQTTRYDTALKCITSFIEEPQYYLLGHGFANFFPFQQWTALNAGVSASAYARFDFNQFDYKGNMLLVQPHNTYVYLLMETGLIGVISFIRISLFGIKNKEGRIQGNVLIVVIAFLLLGLIESTVIVQPGIACMWWLMLGLTKIRFETLVEL